MVTDGLCLLLQGKCAKHTGLQGGFWTVAINHSGSESKYNTHKEKIKMNEKKNQSEKKAIPSHIFLYHGKRYSYGKRIGEGNKRLFPSFF